MLTMKRRVRFKQSQGFRGRLASHCINVMYFLEPAPQQALTVTSFKQPTRTLWFVGSSLAYTLTFMHDMLMCPDIVCIKVWWWSALAVSCSVGWTTEIVHACVHKWGDRKWCLTEFLHNVCVCRDIKILEYVKECMCMHVCECVCVDLTERQLFGSQWKAADARLSACKTSTLNEHGLQLECWWMGRCSHGCWQRYRAPKGQVHTNVHVTYATVCF